MRNDLCHHVAAAFDHSKHGSLFRSAATTLAALGVTADIGLVGLNVTAQRRIAVHAGHVLADQVGHAEGRGVRNAKLALQLLGRNAVARRCEQVGRVKPLRERRVGILKNRALHRVNVVAAIAGIRRLFGELLEASDHTTFGAWEVIPISKAEKVRQTGGVIGKLLEKVLNCQRLSHRYLPMTMNIGMPITYVKFIIA